MVEGKLRGVMVRKPLGMRSWEAGQALIREWEAEGSPDDPVSVREAGEAFLRDAAAQHTAYGTLKNLRLVVNAFSQFAEKKGIDP